MGPSENVLSRRTKCPLQTSISSQLYFKWWVFGAPDTIRTCGLRLRRATIHPRGQPRSNLSANHSPEGKRLSKGDTQKSVDVIVGQSQARPRELGWPPISKQGSCNGGAADLRNYAKRSSHRAKDKQHFVVSVVAYDSLPGHQRIATPGLAGRY